MLVSNPSLLFISEIKSLATQCRNWTSRFQFNGSLLVDCDKRSGGLLILWRDPMEVSIRSYYVGHIDCIVRNGSSWRFTGLYGNPVVSLRQASWQLLGRLSSICEQNQLPWLVRGDFNEILFESVETGGVVRPTAQIQSFSDTLDDSGLQDLSYKWNRFTWSNRRQGDDLIFARLDLFVCNRSWRALFSNAEVENLAFYGSDHRPISLVFHPASLASMTRSTQSSLLLNISGCWRIISPSGLNGVGKAKVSVPICLGNLRNAVVNPKIGLVISLLSWERKLLNCGRNLIN